MDTNSCLFIVAPTCSGKTKLGVSLAESLDGEVISVDSLQCYMSGALVTAQPTADEMKDIPHHMVGYLADGAEPHVDFVPRAMDALARIRARNKMPIFVGGSTSLLLPMLHAVLEQKYDVQAILLSPDVQGRDYERQARKRIDEMILNGLIKELDLLYKREIASNTFSPGAVSWRNDAWRSLKNLFSSCRGQEPPMVYPSGTADHSRHVGVWKTIGYPEMLPYLSSLQHQQHRLDLCDEGVAACVVNTVRYAARQARWIQETFVPVLQLHGISFTSLPVPFDKEAWKLDVEQRALRVVDRFSNTSNDAIPEVFDMAANHEKRLGAVVCIYGGSSSGASPQHAIAARSLAHAFHRRGVQMVFGGGITGIMGEIATELVRLSGPQTVHGVIPQALADYEALMCAKSNLDLRYEERLHGRRTIVKDMHTRKARMVQEVQQGGAGSGFVALSGGYGTAEELMEIVTWRQLGIHDRPVCALNADGLYDGLSSWLQSISAAGFVGAKDQHLLHVCSSPEEVVEQLSRPQENNPHLLKW